MADNTDNIMIALLPTNLSWSTLDYPHLTLVFCGKVLDHKITDFNEMAKDAVNVAMLSNPISLRVKGIEKMGPPEEPVSALMFHQTPELMSMRNILKRWDQSEWPDYLPHATIGPYGATPKFPVDNLSFDRIAVCWGKEKITMWLRRQY